jgi:hypothetical protein
MGIKSLPRLVKDVIRNKDVFPFCVLFPYQWWFGEQQKWN